MNRLSALVVLSSFAVSALFAALPAPPPQLFDNVKDYGYMGWVNGMRDPNFQIQTSRYVLNYNHLAFGPTVLGLLSALPNEATALTQHATPDLPIQFSCRVSGNGNVQPVKPDSEKLTGSQIVESGKFFQRRWQKATIPGGLSTDPLVTGLETAAWPDRLSFILHLSPTAAVTNGQLEMTLDLPDTFSQLLSSGSAKALATTNDSGFILMPTSGTLSLTIDEKKGIVTAKTAVSNWQPGQKLSVGLILYPMATGLRKNLLSIVARETSPLVVTSVGLEPTLPSLPVPYEKDQGFHHLLLPKSIEGDNGRFRARIQIKNPHPTPQIARFNFDGTPFYIPGISALLRDTAGNPLGIPVQLSKDWHTDTPGAAFSGLWFHGLTLVTVPANSTTEFELMMVGENWGTLAAATHSQLSVIGYGPHGQQWDQAALGNKGEALCYEMDQVQTPNAFTDSRPFWALNAKNQRDWAINVGGGSVLRYVDGTGKEQRHRNMRVRYRRYCPNLAEAIFAGKTDDNAMEFSYSAGIYRADDCTRGLHRIRIDVKKETPFRRLAFYQQAGDSYSYNQGSTLSYGNAAQPTPLRQWESSGKRNQNTGTPIALSGPMPWAALTNGPAEKGYKAANHGFIIRSWKAQLNGSPANTPYLQERRNANNVSIFELVPPPGVTQLKPGDYIEADIVRVYVPRSLENYGGPNLSFRQALQEYDNDPRMILREAVGNQLKATVTSGKLENLYPLQIQADRNSAAFTLQGGIGALPVTFTGLTDYRRPILEEKMGHQWKKIDQAVAGNDFWQCDFNPQTRSWEITFTLVPTGAYQNVEALIATPQVRVYRFQLQP